MLVNTVNDLQNVQNNLSGTYALGTNIDASATANWHDGAGFVPIGDLEYQFSGSFNGQGFAINNLTINSSAAYVGLFGNDRIRRLGAEPRNWQYQFDGRGVERFIGVHTRRCIGRNQSRNNQRLVRDRHHHQRQRQPVRHGAGYWRTCGYKRRLDQSIVCKCRHHRKKHRRFTLCRRTGRSGTSPAPSRILCDRDGDEYLD